MTVVDSSVWRRSLRTLARNDRAMRLHPAPSASLVRNSPPSVRALGLGVVSRSDGSGIVVTAVVVPHPYLDDDAVAFLVAEGSDAHLMLRSDEEFTFCFSRLDTLQDVAGPVDLVRANQIQADWLRWMVDEIPAAAGDLSSDSTMHETTTGIPPLVVAFLCPQRSSHQQGSEGATHRSSSPPAHRRLRHSARYLPVHGAAV